MKRRTFLKSTTAAVPMIVSAATLGRGAPPPSDRVRIGLIGLGGRCRVLAREALTIPELEIAAVCDLFKPRVDSMMVEMGIEHSWTPYIDLHRMLDREQLDGVVVATTTHARAWTTCHAMAAGADVYLEKPMCLTIAEGRQMVSAARKFRRVTQVGTQQRSIPLNNWASDLVKNGALGKIRAVLAPNFMGPHIWEPQPPQEMPDGGRDDWWDLWTNQAVLRPYHQDLHRRWNLWWDYDGGGQTFGVTGWGTHSYDQIQRGLGTDSTGPVEVVLEEPVRELPAVGDHNDLESPYRELVSDTGKRYYQMVRESFGSRARVRMKYANGVELLLHLHADHGPGLGCGFVCERGYVEINRDELHSDIEDLLESPERPLTLEERGVPENQPHILDWIRCIKTRGECNANFEFAHRSTSLCYLVNIARDVGRVGETLRWDPEAERFTNCEEGNALLSRPRRRGYELPV